METNNDFAFENVKGIISQINCGITAQMGRYSKKLAAILSSE